MSLPFAAMSFPEMYEQWLVGPLFRPWVEMLIQELGVQPGERVLDIACGTGIGARLAHERVGGSGTVVGVDLSPAMLAVANRVAQGIDWRQGDASALPLQTGERFDVIICHQGFQFFPDRRAAAGEMRRALAEGGRLAVNTWRPDDESPVVRELRRVAERHLGPVVDRRHAFGEPAPIEALLRDAGFRDVRSKTVPRTIFFDEGATFVRLNAMALVGMSGRSSEIGEDERQELVAAIVQDSAEVTALHSRGPVLAFELRTNMTVARG